MVRRGAARREVRQAKRAIARAESGRKKGKRVAAGAAKPLGAIAKAAKGGRGRPGVSTPTTPLPGKRQVHESDSEDQADDEDEPRFTAAEKKIRALQKKLRHIKALKASLARGVELDAQQQAKLRTEKTIEHQIEKINQELAEETERSLDEGREEEEGGMVVVSNGPKILPGMNGSVRVEQAHDRSNIVSGPSNQQEAEENDEPDIDTSGLTPLELKRHIKKMKQKERVRARQAALAAKEEREAERKRARIAASSVTPGIKPSGKLGGK